nr:MAG TPA: hypothetical protein [Caudoviricetes sp.]
MSWWKSSKTVNNSVIGPGNGAGKVETMEKANKYAVNSWPPCDLRSCSPFPSAPRPSWRDFFCLFRVAALVAF